MKNKIKHSSCIFLLISLLSFSGCGSSDNSDSKDAASYNLEMSTLMDYSNLYDFRDGKYVMVEQKTNTKTTIRDKAAGTEETKEETDEDLPDENEEYDNIEIESIDKNKLILLFKSKSIISGTAIVTNWRMPYTIANGTMDDFNSGKFIEIKADSSEQVKFFNSQTNAIKAMMVKALDLDPGQMFAKMSGPKIQIWQISNKSIQQRFYDYELLLAYNK